jgi:hypothetical protein
MKTVLSLILSLFFLIGCENGQKAPTEPSVPTERKVSMNDGVKYDGNYMPISALRNTLSMKLILACMGHNIGRYDCQCSVDNLFKDMDAEEFLEFLKSKESPWKDRRFLSAREYCSDKPLEKIPSINKNGGILGGEIRTFIMKEITLDCVGGGDDEKKCSCYADGSVRLFKKTRKLLEIIDGRKENMAKYKTEDIDKLEKLYADCGLK